MDDSSPARRGLRGHTLAALALSSAWFVGCAGFQGTTAASFLRNIREDPDPNVRFISYQKLASPQCYDSAEQKAEAVRVLIAKFEEGHEPIATRALICKTLGTLGDPAARGMMLKAVSDSEGLIRAQACRALGRVGKPEDATILTRVMTVDTLEDCRIAAIEALGTMKARDPRIAEVLVGGLEHDDPAVRLASLEALRSITGKDVGTEAEDWQKYFVGQSGKSSADQPKAETVAGRGSPSSPVPFEVTMAPTEGNSAPPIVATGPPTATTAFPPVVTAPPAVTGGSPSVAAAVPPTIPVLPPITTAPALAGLPSASLPSPTPRSINAKTETVPPPFNATAARYGVAAVKPAGDSTLPLLPPLPPPPAGMAAIASDRPGKTPTSSKAASGQVSPTPSPFNAVAAPFGRGAAPVDVNALPASTSSRAGGAVRPVKAASSPTRSQDAQNRAAASPLNASAAPFGGASAPLDPETRPASTPPVVTSP
jgi:hypothetical protein